MFFPYFNYILILSNLMQSFKISLYVYIYKEILYPSFLCNFLTIYIYIYLLQPFQWRSNYYNVNENKEMSQLLYFLIKLFQWRHIIVHDTKFNDSFKADKVGGSKKLHKETFIIKFGYRKLRSFQMRKRAKY